MQIGDKIKRMRIEKGLTQEELANRCELSKGFISQVENDLTSPSIATLIDILEILGTNLKEFFSDDKDEKITYKYEDMFTIEKDNNGNITMVKSNINAINEIISEVAVKIQNEIDNKGNENVKIALGSFTGFALLAGKGPSVKIQISSMGNVQTDLRSEFTSQGINQTLHRVYLQVVCEVSILTPFENIKSSITNQVLLVENVIVGNTPNTYYNLEGLTKENTIDIIE